MRETNNLNVLRFCALSCFVARCSLFVVQMQLQARAISSVSVPRAFHMDNAASVRYYGPLLPPRRRGQRAYLHVISMFL